MADQLELPGRDLDGEQFTAILERLTQISLTATLVQESTDRFSRDELLSLISQIRERAIEAMVLAGTTDEESQQMNRHMMDNMGLGGD
ncbi:Resolvase, N terminal domain [Tranquillimonas rosea]|uniref:Resolvase, N terminal domain n=1 Tax=Tranquillimonas rosea TaxID=641238 RepID=A0A1H9UK95_9RHOB|nr:recombinase family protein [Tranquillimonas rosea]SES09708.1 Resolvase, N terminal domain [Tranquillimonas rosea]